MRTTLVAAVAILAFAVAPVGAFSSFEFYGGAHHEQISTEALHSLGFSQESLYWIHLGNLHNDKFYRSGFDAGHHHFTDMDFEATAHHLDEGLTKIVELAGRAEQNYQAYQQTLTLFGEYLHSVQDFYAHTNWVEQSVARGEAHVPLVPESEGWNPPGVVSPYFLYQVLPPGEVKDVSKHERQWGREFYRSQQLEAMSSRERILLSARPARSFIHWQLAKDDPTYPQSSLKWHSQGPSLFELARDAAIRDSRRQWHLIEARLQARYGQHGARIANLLKKGWHSSFAESSDSNPRILRLRLGDVSLSESFFLKVELTLEPETWDQVSAQQAIDVFHRLLDRRGGKRLASEGLSEVRFLKDDEGKVFRMDYQANLYGASRSFLTLRPLEQTNFDGTWVARIRLPKEVRDLERLTFRTAGRIVSQIGPSRDREHQLRLDPPTDGWDPPRWVAEYLRDQPLPAE